jgi:ferric-dicitrate binding protein FerR (iron transport regulator)
MRKHPEECTSCRGEARDRRPTHERLTDLANATEALPQERKSRVLTAMPRRRETRWVSLVAAAAVLCVLAVLGVRYSSRFFGPDEVASATLEPTDLAPGAGGELQGQKEDPNVRAELEVWGLPQPGPNKYHKI